MNSSQSKDDPDFKLEIDKRRILLQARQPSRKQKKIFLLVLVLVVLIIMAIFSPGLRTFLAEASIPLLEAIFGTLLSNE